MYVCVTRLAPIGISYPPSTRSTRASQPLRNGPTVDRPREEFMQHEKQFRPFSVSSCPTIQYHPSQPAPAAVESSLPLPAVVIIYAIIITITPRPVSGVAGNRYWPISSSVLLQSRKKGIQQEIPLLLLISHISFLSHFRQLSGGARVEIITVCLV